MSETSKSSQFQERFHIWKVPTKKHAAVQYFLFSMCSRLGALGKQGNEKLILEVLTFTGTLSLWS